MMSQFVKHGVTNVEWEIQQLWLAIEYYEKAIEESFSRREADGFRETVRELNVQLKELERKRDGC